MENLKKLILLIIFLTCYQITNAGIGMTFKEVQENYGMNYILESRKDQIYINYNEMNIRLIYDVGSEIVTKQVLYKVGEDTEAFKKYVEHNYKYIKNGWYYYQTHERGYEIHTRINETSIEFILPSYHKYLFFEKLKEIFLWKN